jgi:hypothetical protein
MSEKTRESRDTKPFLCSYHHDGGEWSVTIHAYDWADAEARIQKLGFLRLDGELIAEFPASAGFIAKSACWLRNFFKATK